MTTATMMITGVIMIIGKITTIGRGDDYRGGNNYRPNDNYQRGDEYDWDDDYRRNDYYGGRYESNSGCRYQYHGPPSTRGGQAESRQYDRRPQDVVVKIFGNGAICTHVMWA